ncbi:MAG: Hsp20/alpha crystallin family protein [Methanomicrobiales archaeon]|nr:Hsp20/alpha crystallin family protein [Methanomicrobiales archaeon]
MTWRGTPFGIWGEFDDRAPEVQRRLREQKEAFGIPRKPVETGKERGSSAEGGGDVHVDIRESPDEMAVAVSIPPSQELGLAIRLLDRRTLRIEGGSGSGTKGDLRQPIRTVFLPAEVTAEGARARFDGGLLEVRLKKSMDVRGEIPLEHGRPPPRG